MWAELQLRDEDRETIIRLDISDVGSWVQQRIEEYEYRIRALKFAHNAASPINRTLPPEVLANICSHPPQTAYLLVCRAWHSILLQTPRFWAALVNEPHTLGGTTGRENGQYGRYLERSGTVPLNLYINHFDVESLHMLTPHCHHITSLRVDLHMVNFAESGSAASLLNSLLVDVGIPSLVHLGISHLHRLHGQRDDTPLVLDCQCLPRLRSLAHPWTTVTIGDAVAQLRHLHLEGCSTCDGAPFDVRSLLNKLDQCPLLESLCLSQAGITSSGRVVCSTRNDIPIPVVHLAALARLDIRDCHEAIVRTVLSYLSYPSTCHVSLGGAKSLPDLIPASTFAPVMRADRVKIEFQHRLFSHEDMAALTTYIDGSQALSFSFKAGPGIRRLDALKAFQTYLTELSEVFSETNAVTDLLFEGQSGHGSPSLRQNDGKYFAMLLDALPGLQRLELRGWDCRQWLIALLGRPAPVASLGTSVTSASNRGCLCPQMRTLTVCWQPAADEATTSNDALKKARDGLDDGALRGSVVLDDSCGGIARMLRYRAEQGSPLSRLSVRVPRGIIGTYVDDEGWEPPVLRERMWKRLGDLVETLDVSYLDGTGWINDSAS